MYCGEELLSPYWDPCFGPVGRHVRPRFDTGNAVVLPEQTADVVLGVRQLVALCHDARHKVNHVLDEVPGVDDPRPLFERLADEVRFVVARLE